MIVGFRIQRLSEKNSLSAISAFREGFRRCLITSSPSFSLVRDEITVGAVLSRVSCLIAINEKEIRQAEYARISVRVLSQKAKHDLSQEVTIAHKQSINERCPMQCTGQLFILMLVCPKAVAISVGILFSHGLQTRQSG